MGGGGVKQKRTNAEQGGGRGSKIGNFLRTSFMDGPLLLLFHMSTVCLKILVRLQGIFLLAPSARYVFVELH